MIADLLISKAEFIDAAQRFAMAAQTGGLRQYAGCEFALAFRREQINDALAVGVVVLEEKCASLQSAFDSLGSDAQHFAPTLTLSHKTAASLRELVISDSACRVLLATQIEEFDAALNSFAAKLERLKTGDS